MWTRHCPSCQKTIDYKHKSTWKRCMHLSTSCLACAATKRGIKNTKERIPIYCPTCGKIKSYLLPNTKAVRRALMNCKRCALHIRPSNRKGKTMPLSAKILLSQKLGGKNHPQYGKPLSEDHKRKIRIAVANDLATKRKIVPNYNRVACTVFDLIGVKTDTKIQHAENGGEVFISELGFWLDGYDRNNNIAYEWCEKHHFKADGTFRQKDIIRIAEIKKLFKCDFCVIIEENGNVVFIEDVNSLPNHRFTQ